MMKKTLLFTIGITLATLSRAQVTFGVKAGANLSGVQGKDAPGTSAMVGFHAGLQAGIPLKAQLPNGDLSLQPELFYSTEGAKVPTESQGDGDQIFETTAKAHLNYIDLPILLQYRHPSGFLIQSGPQLGYLLSAKLKADGASTDIKDEFKKTNLSWVLGVGYAIHEGKIGFNLRYNFGFTKLAKPVDGQPSGKAFGRVLQAGVFSTL
jgi:hypothetical protein